MVGWVFYLFGTLAQMLETTLFLMVWDKQVLITGLMFIYWLNLLSPMLSLLFSPSFPPFRKLPNQPHLLKKYQINMGFLHFHEIGILSGMYILAPYQIDFLK